MPYRGLFPAGVKSILDPSFRYVPAAHTDITKTFSQRQRDPMSAPASFPALLTQYKRQIELALPKHLNADRMARIALTCYRNTPQLAECEPASVFAAVIQAAQLGLEPGLNGRAHLIPYKDSRTNKVVCQMIPGWKGLVELSQRSGRCSVWTGVIYQGQKFDYQQGDAPHLLINDIAKEDDSTKIAYAYACGRVKGSDWPVLELWTAERIRKHRDRYNRIGKKHYSYENWEMYARKVVLLQVLKYLPATPELEAAIILNDAAEIGAQRLTIEDAIEGTFVPTPADELIAEHDDMKAAKSVKELAEIFTKLTAEEKKTFKAYYDIRHGELEQVQE
jgi:recombination protein RecT